MKKMQKFHKGLSSVHALSTTRQRNLAALTRLNHDQVSDLSRNLVWFIWSAEAAASAR